MKQQKLAVLLCGFLLSVAASAQLFKPLGLGIEATRDMVAEWFQPQMHIEGDILYVCTAKGLYSKNLSNSDSPWQLVGFEDIPLQDYARNGDDILALRHCYYNHTAFTLLSHDGGKTYEDITPSSFLGKGYAFMCFEQHPNAPEKMLTISSHNHSLYMTSDFGKTWEKLPDTVIAREDMPGEYIGFHPLNPDILYASGYIGDSQTAMQISYDGGKTWQKRLPYTSWTYNNAYRMAFHPTDPNRWIAGGQGCIYVTNDNGQTWEMRFLPQENSYHENWRYTVYDNTNADIIYFAGHQANRLTVTCSVDGGETLCKLFQEQTATTEFMFDMKQYRDKLLIYSQSDVYEISKSALIDNTTAVHGITPKVEGNSIHDLQGRQLQHEPARGVFIKDGRKWVK